MDLNPAARKWEARLTLPADQAETSRVSRRAFETTVMRYVRSVRALRSARSFSGLERKGARLLSRLMSNRTSSLPFAGRWS